MESQIKLDNAQLLSLVKSLIPSLEQGKYKGQAGKVGVIGGCREYTGAPFFAAYSALKVGADLSHVFCTSPAATVIKTYSPELIVHPYLSELAVDIPQPDADPSEHSTLRDQIVEEVTVWLDRFDVLVIGPGLGRDPLILTTVERLLEKAREREIPLVIDADGLWLLNIRPDLIIGYSQAVLTPNKVEFRRLCSTLGIEESAPDALQQVARRLQGPIVVQKGSEDCISDGNVTIRCAETGSLRRAGGQGDVLSGTIAAFVAWSRRSNNNSTTDSTSSKDLKSESGSAPVLPPLIAAAYGGCLVTRVASRRAFIKHGRAMGASDVIAELGSTIDEDLAPTPKL